MSDKPRFFRSDLFFIFLFVSIAQISAQNPRLSPIPMVESLSQMIEPLSNDIFIEAALVFSDVPEEYMSQGKKKILGLIDQATFTTADISEDAKKAEAILEFMHDNVLTSYMENRTSMRDLLEHGVYNCVSSAVLYMILAKSVSLEVAGVRTTDHAFCLVNTGTKEFDVETTNRYGFDPGSKKQFLDAFGKATGYTYVPQNQYSQRLKIGERELLSIILHNRASLHGTARRFFDAVGPSVDAYGLLGNEDSFDKMMISFMNLGAWFNQSGDYEGGLLFLEDATDRYGSDSRLENARSTLVQNRIADLLESRDWESVNRLLDVYQNKKYLSDAKWKEFKVHIVRSKAQELAANEGFLQAYNYIETVIENIGDNNLLNRSRDVYKYNFEVQAHNAMVKAFQDGDIQGARRIIVDALSGIPDSQTLIEDLQVIDRQLLEP